MKRIEIRKEVYEMLREIKGLLDIDDEEEVIERAIIHYLVSLKYKIRK